MKIYETWDILQHRDFNFFDNKENLNWENHFHRAYEFVITVEGEMVFTVDETDYTLKKGDAVFVMPNQFHSVKTDKYSKFHMLRFMPNLAGSFYTAYNGKIPETNKFYMPSALSPEFAHPNNLYQRKSLVYKICGEFCEQVTKWHDAAKNNDLLAKMLLSIERDFTEQCSLKNIAKELGYDYKYLSKFFLKCTGISFVDYLNDCRINHACYLVQNSEMDITHIAHDCGYNSIRSFNRNFLSHVGTTPLKYRKMIAK